MDGIKNFGAPNKFSRHPTNDPFRFVSVSLCINRVDIDAKIEIERKAEHEELLRVINEDRVERFSFDVCRLNCSTEFWQFEAKIFILKNWSKCVFEMDIEEK